MSKPRLSSHLLPVIILSVCFAVTLTSGCTSTSTTSSLPNGTIPYESIDRRAFTDAGIQVRTAHGNRVSVEVAGRDTLVWFEHEETGAFTRAFLRRGNTIYVLTQESDFFRGSPSQTVAYRLFMQAWRKADTTSGPVAPSLADERE